jgi:superkiller protein 3
MNQVLDIDIPEESLILNQRANSLLSKDIFLHSEQEEEYQFLLRSVGWTDGFGLFFVECIFEQAERIIQRLKADLPKKNIEVLSLTEPIDNLYNLVDRLPNRDNIDVLFVRGLEYSLNEYIQPEGLGFGGQGGHYKEDSVPRILAHLNLQRERFRDSFNICFIFLLPEFAVKYFIRHAPDFYDWRSGLFEFSTDQDILKEVLKVINEEFKEENIDNLSFSQCQENLLKIDSIIEEIHQNLTTKLDLWLKKGLLLVQSERYNEAIDSYNKVLKVNNVSSQAWYYLGLALMMVHRPEEAIASFDKAIRLDPDNHKTFFSRGLALESLGQLEEALSDFDQALKLQANHYQSWYNRGVILAALGQYQEEIIAYDQAIAIKEDLHEAYYNKGVALGYLGNYEEAIINYQKSLKIKPDKYPAWVSLGIALSKLGRYLEAIDSYDQELFIKQITRRLGTIGALL